MRKDYALTIIAVAYFLYLMSLALYQLKYLYAEHGTWFISLVEILLTWLQYSLGTLNVYVIVIIRLTSD